MNILLGLLVFIPGLQEEALIQQMVYESQEAGLIHHDFDAYMSVWSRNAAIIGGRGPEPGLYDVTQTYDKFRAVRSRI